MSAITIPRPDVTVEEVSATLRHGLGPGYQVLPGMKTPVLPGEPDPGWPGSIVVGTGSAHVFRAQLRVDRHDGQTRIRVDPAGLVWIRLVNTFLIAPKVRRVLRAASASSRGPPRSRARPWTGASAYSRQSLTAWTSSPARSGPCPGRGPPLHGTEVNSRHFGTVRTRLYDVDVPFMQLEQHGWDIHAI